MTALLLLLQALGALGMVLPGKTIFEKTVRDFVAEQILAQSPEDLKRGQHPDDGLSLRNDAELEGCLSIECAYRYAQIKDDVYGWKLIKTRKQIQDDVPLTVHLLAMTSQRWLSEKEVNKPLWTHDVNVYIPDKMTPEDAGSEWATVFLAGSHEARDVEYVHAARTAAFTNSIAVVLTGVPNENINLSDESMSLAENDLQAHLRMRFLESPHVQWMVEMPMVKSVIRGMDTVTEFTKKAIGKGVSRFGLAGHSKRALVTWMVSGIDPRVEVMVPVSMALNQTAHFHDLMKSLGNPAAAFASYTKLFNVSLGLEFNMTALLLEPTNYQESMRQHKLVIFGPNDEYSLPDNWMNWWSLVSEPKSLLYIPNRDHIGTWIAAGEQIQAFMYSVIHNEEVPRIEWEVSNETGHIFAKQVSGPTDVEAKLWRATSCNAKRRDFRLYSMDEGAECYACGIPRSFVDGCHNYEVKFANSSMPQDLDGGLEWTANVSTPSNGGWNAYFITLEYPPVKPGGPRMMLSTGASIWPNSYPFKGCTPGKDCDTSKMKLVLTQEVTSSGKIDPWSP